MNNWQIGDISLSRIVESEEPLLSPYEIFMDCGREHIAANLGWLAPRFYDPSAERLVITIQSFLVRHGDLNILVDTCSGNGKERARPFFDRRDWPWLERLRAAGVEPEDIDIVMCTHLHVDHVGWNTRLENGRWVPTFANARYLVSRREWEYWKSEAGRAALPRTGDYVADSILPVFAAGQAEFIDEDHALGANIWLEPTPGHTPGHFAVHLCDGDAEAILSGDLVHHPLQLRYPDWSTRFCADPNAARDSRKRFLSTYAGSGKIIVPAHFPGPVGGVLERAGDHYGFRFCGEAQPIAMR